VVLATLALIGLSVNELLRDKPYNVIILTVDSLRTTDFTPKTAPHFFAAMKDATVPNAHRTVSAWTAPNIIAILTGLSPFDQGVHARGQFIPGDGVSPLGALAAQGWTVGNVQAFATSDVFKNIGVTLDTASTWQGWLARRVRGGEPFALWHHYLDVHLPYSPATASVQPHIKVNSPEQQARIDEVRTRSAIPIGSVAFEQSDRPLIHDLYLGGVRQFDDWFAEFWRFFKKAGLDKNTILVVTADHGEELLERGRVGHASTTHDASLHEEIVNIPLLILLPPSHPLKQAGFALGPDVETDHLDIMPTVLSLLGVQPSQPLAGRDLTVDQRARPWFAYSSKGGYGEADPNNIESFVGAVMSEQRKLIVRMKDRKVVPLGLYDLHEDPMERQNLLVSAGTGIDQLASRDKDLVVKMTLARHFEPQQGTGGSDSPAPEVLWPKLDAQTETALGYDDLAGRFSIEWSGAPSTHYILAYELGEQPFSLSGEMRINGTRKDFGKIDRHYWDTWVVPYKKVRIRIRPENGQMWSNWTTLVFEE